MTLCVFNSLWPLLRKGKTFAYHIIENSHNYTFAAFIDDDKHDDDDDGDDDNHDDDANNVDDDGDDNDDDDENDNDYENDDDDYNDNNQSIWI